MRFRLIPRDESFYPLWIRGGVAADAAVTLGLLLRRTAGLGGVQQISSLPPRRRAMACSRRPLSASKRVVTPFDREDIQYLAGRSTT